MWGWSVLLPLDGALLLSYPWGAAAVVFRECLPICSSCATATVQAPVCKQPLANTGTCWVVMVLFSCLVVVLILFLDIHVFFKNDFKQCNQSPCKILPYRPEIYFLILILILIHKTGRRSLLQ